MEKWKSWFFVWLLLYEENYLKMRNVIEVIKIRYMKIGLKIDESILEGLNELEDY